jgi:outer membrane protein OmpA-like peptidoglycan-associated protein
MKRIVLVALLVLTGAARADDLDTAGLAAAIEKARSEHVDVLAPTGFAAAVQAHEAAQKDAARGRSADKVRSRVQEGEAALRRATSAAASARTSLDAAIKAREDAVTAQAPQLAPQSWPKAAERFEQAVKENERGDLKSAQRRGAEAQVLLREAELVAVEAGILNEARSLIAQADEAKVERYAPRTLQAAKRDVAEAEQEIRRNRYEVDVPRKLAAQARYEVRHATYLAQQIERVLQQEKDDQSGIEALILSWEGPIGRLASDLELTAHFDQGMEAPLRELGERAQQQAQEVRRLKQEIESRDEQIAALGAELQRTESRLGGESAERIALQRRVDEQERLRSSVAAIEASFTPDEARVFRQGEDVVVSLLGVRFTSGRSTIGSSNAAIMGKLRQALVLFSGASISIEGHTDANGGDSANLILSQDRADAVKQYLVTTFAMDPEKVSSIGYGEARPVATNETAAGRARNRRIDVVIHTGTAKGGSGSTADR